MRLHILIAVLLVLPGLQMARSQSSVLKAYSITAQQSLLPVPPSNSVSHVAADAGQLWIGTGKGLARSSNAGHSWEEFGSRPQFASPGIYSITLKGETVWVSTGFTQDINDQSVQTGSGYAYSLDRGTTWHGATQPLDARSDTIVTYGRNRVRFLPIVVPEQNVTFDAAISDSAIWVASWSSGLRSSRDLGATWQRTVLPSAAMNSISPNDSLGYYSIDPRRDNNYLAFSVLVSDDSTIWAGTAGGINRSTDGGRSWYKFTSGNQLSHILGDWVIALGAQPLRTHTRIWATNWPAEGAGQEYCVSFTDDNGRTWTNMLRGVKAYAFAFKDSVTYVATDDGLYRSSDAGASWIRSGTVIDSKGGARITSNTFFSVAVLGDTVFGGTEDGLVSTVDNAGTPFGRDWSVFRTYVPVANRSTNYAYPNPFSPRSEVSRVHYSTGDAGSTVSLEFFDFGMNRVRTVINNAQRAGGAEFDEIWDGRDDGGTIVPNGVYFYRLTFGGSDAAWGKVMVLQ